MKPKAPAFFRNRLQSQTAFIPERTMWSYITQIAIAIKTVHEAGQAVRMIDATKMLVTGKNRFGVYDSPSLTVSDPAYPLVYASVPVVSWML
jgi:PAB-dependent poly(A)-specific ribonuclease subunit 3